MRAAPRCCSGSATAGAERSRSPRRSIARSASSRAGAEESARSAARASLELPAQRGRARRDRGEPPFAVDPQEARRAAQTEAPGPRPLELGRVGEERTADAEAARGRALLLLLIRRHPRIDGDDLG